MMEQFGAIPSKVWVPEQRLFLPRSEGDSKWCGSKLIFSMSFFSVIICGCVEEAQLAGRCEMFLWVKEFLFYFIFCIYYGKAVCRLLILELGPMSC